VADAPKTRIVKMRGFSSDYDRALIFAARAHRSQLRKGSDIPYLAHVVHVSVILLRHGYAEPLAIAALLHDVVEDCDVALATVEAEFGAEVARLVEAVSETKAADGHELPWEQRKSEKLAHLRAGGPEVAALKAADAIHNARSICADLRAEGPLVWERFKRGPEQSLWYYREILAAVRVWLDGEPIAEELAEAVAELAVLAGD
jgi:(p)ppGpp synthase/HD superfamily hydrolase